MANQITGKEYPLKEIFSKNFDFHMPGYQRPYAWTQNETEELFDDIYRSFCSNANADYFLGSIVLAKEDDKPRAEVIDGQQRLVTLTILLAVMASYFSGEKRTNWDKYLMEEGNEFEDVASQPRLHLRAQDQPFFCKYIQDVQLDALAQKVGTSLKDEAQKNIKHNCAVLRKRIEEKIVPDISDPVQKEEPVFAFAKYLIQHCYVIVVSTPDEKTSCRIFSILNDRGMNLLPIDIIKSKVIGGIAKELQDEYTQKWEEMEQAAGRDGFNNLIIYTRMIFARTKSEKDIVDEFERYVINKVPPKKLIDEVLEPFSRAYVTIAGSSYKASQQAESVNSYLRWLNKIDDKDWMPAAIKFFAVHENDEDYVRWFVEKYERLAACLYITGLQRRNRINRYAKVLLEMDQGQDSLQHPLQSVELTDKEKSTFVEKLNGNVYDLSANKKSYVILRLNDFIGDSALQFDSINGGFSIEHVLPQTIREGSPWRQDWPEQKLVDEWLNKIANLVALTSRKNSAAGNDDFASKKEKYFSYKHGVTTYPLTTQVLNEEHWTPEVLERRQRELLQIFRKHWDLAVRPSGEVTTTATDNQKRSPEKPAAPSSKRNRKQKQEGPTTSKCAYVWISELLQKGLLPAEEIALLKEKRYTQSLFPHTDYPVLADSYEAHMGNSKTKRYWKQPIEYAGTKIYISTQWYKQDFGALKAWYEKHLEQ